jgi:hypothetical protein
MTTETQDINSEYLALRRRMIRAVASVHGVITQAENDRRDELEALLTADEIARVERLAWV